MRRLVFTDLFRAQKKKSYVIMMGLVAALIIIVAIIAFVWPSKAAEESAKAERFLTLHNIVATFIPFLVGIPVFQAVFTDDFKSRTMQTAIGRGISRSRLVLSRFLEACMLIVEAMAIFSVVTLIAALAVGTSVSGTFLLLARLWVDASLIVAHLSVCMFFVYASQNTTLGLVFFILFSANVFGLLLKLVDSIPFLNDNGIEISKMVPTGVHTSMSNYLFGTKAVLDTTDLSKLLEPAIEANFGKALVYGIVFIGVYIILPVFLSQAVFRKKELEF
ncbi:MAG: hypothetical protein IJM27_12895 [Eubacterium sp.]|nr:hypothetical protein [Eubacterium sp.]